MGQIMARLKQSGGMEGALQFPPCDIVISTGQEDAMKQTRFINPQGLAKPPGYTHVVEVSAPARVVYVAGQLGNNLQGEFSTDFRQQAVQTFENLKIALAAVGASFQHVVKFNNYLLDMNHLPVFRQVRDSYLPDAGRPASTTIAISGLARAGALVEIEAVAVLPATDGKHASGELNRRAPAKASQKKGKAVQRRRRKRG
jgi:enamine deaminase RidA (YjgF/YER057c/UK114 family)